MSLTRKNRNLIRTAHFMLFLMAFQCAFPNMAFGLTSGPTQPEFQTFEPAGTTEMVDLFSGDFTYNIPLFEVPGPDGGYPINLFYNSVTDANTEASWVGLGWNINIGSINRSLRGLPDEFDGEKIERRVDMKPNWTVHTGAALKVEPYGYDINNNLTSNVGLTLGINHMYNSYKGLGMSFDPQVGISLTSSTDDQAAINKAHTKNKPLGFSPNLNLGFSFSSFDGASMNTGIGIDNLTEEHSSSFGLGLGLNGREGVESLTLSASRSKNETFTRTKVKENETITKTGTVNGTMSFGGTLSFSRNTYTPQVALPWIGSNFTASVTIGGELPSTLLGGTFSGGYSDQHIKNRGQWQSRTAFGYNHTEKINSNHKAIRDFSRENGRTLHKQNKYLANPVFTHDVFQVMGQGIGGSFRAHRSDYGVLTDQAVKSGSGGGTLGLEVGLGGTAGVGVDIVLTAQAERNILWNAPNFGNYQFEGNSPNSDYEAVYYKMSGDNTTEPEGSYDHVLNEQPLKSKVGKFYGIDNTLYGKTSNDIINLAHVDTKNKRTSRKPRTSSIQPITNKVLLDNNEDELLSEYIVDYYNVDSLNNWNPANKTRFLRSSGLTRDNHIAGYSILGNNGVKWNYALPVYNHEQREANFSVKVDPNEKACLKTVDIPITSTGEIDYKQEGTIEFINETKMPAYVQSYLMTSVLGNDYVDLDATPGPSDGDMGYWMKTNYVKITDNYRWRAPFYGANFIEGYKSKVSDDKAAFSYGRRDMYLPASIETKTHIAEFILTQRDDARGAGKYIQNFGDSNAHGEYSYSLKEIKLYSKNDKSTPIKTISFKYHSGGNELCGGVHNNETGGGKLTLASVHFKYGANSRGELSPYKFTYSNLNPPYDDYIYDRWGAFKPYDLIDPNDPNSGIDKCENVNFPYTKQFDHSGSNSDFKEDSDDRIAAWHIKKIQLPSGATINLDLERDDYAHVQNAEAMEMFKVKKIGTSIWDSGPLEVFSKSSMIGGQNKEDRRVYFELKTPITAGSSQSEIREYILNNYLNDLPETDRGKQLYYKFLMRLKAPTDDTTEEHVSGYVDLQTDAIDDIGVDDTQQNSNGDYTTGYITLRESRMDIKGENYHPIMVMTWKFLKENLPDHMYKNSPGDMPQNNQEKLNMITKLSSMTAGFGAIFRGYFTYAKDKDFGRAVNMPESYIRLNSPDKKKLGGDARVKQITLKDNWNTNETPTYGMVYDYSTTDVNGKKISSGVLENETFVGYDICPLQYAQVNEEVRKGKVKDIFYNEFPINSGYYPGAKVGYSKVTVNSLATEYSKLNPSDPDRPADIPEGFSPTGKTVQEFYTAKDFPVISNATILDDRETNPWVNMLLSIFFKMRKDYYTGTQGYSIQINDMHGKPKGVKVYGQGADNNFIDKPLSKVEYVYQSDKKVITDRGIRKEINVLNNTVETLISDNDLTATVALKETRVLGVDHEFFVDNREKYGVSGTVGITANVDFTIPFLVFPSVWPDFSSNENKVRTSVTNKVIRKSGILKEVKAWDGQALVTTQNELFDALTGVPVMTTVQNSFDDDIYSYQIPAHTGYKGMGPAYKNWGYNVVGKLGEKCAEYWPLEQDNNPPNFDTDLMVPGDVYIGEVNNQKMTATYMGILNDNSVNPKPHFDFDFDDVLLGFGLNFDMKVIRSGYRNLLTPSIVSYTALSDPTENRVLDSCDIDIPVLSTQQVLSSYNTLSQLEKNIAVINQLLKPEIREEWLNSSSPNLWFDIRSIPSILNGFGSSNVCITYPFVFWSNSGNTEGLGISGISNNPSNSQFSIFYPNNFESINCDLISHLELVQADQAIPGNSIVRFFLIDGTSTDFSLADTHQSCKAFLSSHCFLDETIVQTTPGPTMNFRKIDDVLSTSALRFDDSWAVDAYDPCDANEDLNPYQKGEKGIWRLKSSHAYIDERYQTGEDSATATVNNDVNLKVDGQFDNVPLFDWENAFTSYCTPGWIKTNEITRYASNGNPIEEVNALGIKSSVLYGYRDNLVSMAAANSSYEEIGFEGFESYVLPSNFNSNIGLNELAEGKNHDEGNLSFLPDVACDNTVTNCFSSNLQMPLAFHYSGGTTIDIFTFKGYNPNTPLPFKFRLSLGNTSNTITQYIMFANPVSQSPWEFPPGCYQDLFGGQVCNTGNTSVFKTKYTVTLDVPCTYTVNTGHYYMQELKLYSCNTYPITGNVDNNNPTSSLSEETAHTGKYSLKVATGSSAFPQKQLSLTSGQKYVLGAWVHRDNRETPTFDDGDLKIIFDNKAFVPKGAIIDGWQRIEGTFTYLGNQDLIFEVGTNPAWFDDIRIFPADGNAETYVYDPKNYKLRATLDNNNFASIYKYDPAGNLVSVHKETERGLVTIQESNSYVPATDQVNNFQAPPIPSVFSGGNGSTQ